MDEGKYVYCVHVIISDKVFGDIGLNTEPTDFPKVLLNEAEGLARNGCKLITYHRKKKGGQDSDWSSDLDPSELEDLALGRIKSLTS